MSTTADVLVVGAGPVGMAMAMELSIQGLTSFRIVDKTSTRSDKSRALGVHTRTMEVLNRYGDQHSIHELLATKASSITGSALWVNRKQYVLMDKSKAESASEATRTTPESQFDGPFVISQVHTEAFLERRLKERGVAVEYQVAVKSIDQDDDGCTVILTKADGSEETLRCKYVVRTPTFSFSCRGPPFDDRNADKYSLKVGCDGAHSIVRHSMNVTFQGDAYPQEFILADTKIDWDLKGSQDAFQTMLGDGLVFIFPMGNGRARITASRPDHVGSEEEPTLEDFDQLIAKMLPAQDSVPKPRLHDPFWLTRFHLSHRCVSKYRDGRLFVAGDAAHIHRLGPTTFLFPYCIIIIIILPSI